MLKKLFDAASYLYNAPSTKKKQLDVIVNDVTLLNAGEEYDGDPLIKPIYVLSLTCVEKPKEVSTKESASFTWTRTSTDGFNVMVGVDEIDAALVQQLTPGTEAAFRGELRCDGKGWGYFTTHGGMGVQTYFLADIKLGRAENPVNPTEVLASICYGSEKQKAPSPSV